jgi:hypothetical protein
VQLLMFLHCPLDFTNVKVFALDCFVVWRVLTGNVVTHFVLIVVVYWLFNLHRRLFSVRSHHVRSDIFLLMDMALLFIWRCSQYLQRIVLYFWFGIICIYNLMGTGKVNTLKAIKK